MIKAEKKLIELGKVLRTTNNTFICEAIELLREERPFEGAIALLTSVYDKTDDRPTRKAIEGFMNDLKDQNAAIEIMDQINKPWNNNTISMLAASCWQSCLDYSRYMANFAEIFMKGDFTTAVECLTVIQESISKITREEKDEIRNILYNNPMVLRKEKSELLNELLSILDS